MKPIESNYTSHVAYTRALEEYCEMLTATIRDNNTLLQLRGIRLVEQATKIESLLTAMQGVKYAVKAIEGSLNEADIAHDNFIIALGIRASQTLADYRNSVLDDVISKLSAAHPHSVVQCHLEVIRNLKGK